METIFITGAAGFIGSNFIPYFLENHKEIKVLNLLTYAGNVENVKSLENNERYIFEKGDICDRSLIKNLFKKYNFTSVIHFTAEFHVDNSILNPDAFIKTNVFGTFNFLDVSKNHWMDAPHIYKKEFENCRFHHISTDEVYGSLRDAGFLQKEASTYAPNSLYSASKTTSDFMVKSYFHTYGMHVVITNC